MLETERKQSPSPSPMSGVPLRTERCDSVHRLLSTLKWYQKKPRRAEKVIEFIHSKHPQMVDDYTHFVADHNFNDNVIVGVIINVHHQCNIEHCPFIKRFYRNRCSVDREGDAQSTESAEYLFYRDALDAVHCYLYHQSFNDSFKGGDDGRCHRFSLNVNGNDDHKEENETVMIPTDGLFAYLEQNGTSSMDLAQIGNSLSLKEYDGAVLISNICKMTNNESLQKLIIEYVQFPRYDGGLRFYYWNHHRLLSQLCDHDDDVNVDGNGNGTKYPLKSLASNGRDDSGYAVHQLFVDQKYANLKEEMMANMQCTLTPFQFAVSARKAELLCSSQRVRAMKCGAVPFYLRHYGILEGSGITKQHILSVVLYCDWQTLCDALCASFKFNTASFKNLDEIKGRNREFANWSKLLRETVELFGCDRITSGGCNGGGGGGDHHHGVSVSPSDALSFESMSSLQNEVKLHCSATSVYVFSAMKMRMAAPVSTSLNIRMASRCLTDQGILIQCGAPQSGGAFDCSWISSHPQEAEYLVFGGMDRVRIEGITEVDGNRSHFKYLKALTHFQSMLCFGDETLSVDVVDKSNGDDHGNSAGDGMLHHHQMGIDENDDEIIRNLMDHCYFDEYPQYINCSFFAFCHETTSIVLDLHWIYTRFGALSDLVIHSLVRSPFTRSRRTETDKLRENLFRESMVRLFPNLKRIVIRSGNEHKQYPLSFTALLSSIDSTSMFCRNKVRIEVTAQWRSPQKRSWIFHALNNKETMKWITTRATKHGLDLVVTPCTTRLRTKSGSKTRMTERKRVKGKRRMDRHDDVMEDAFIIDHICNF